MSLTPAKSAVVAPKKAKPAAKARKGGTIIKSKVSAVPRSKKRVKLPEVSQNNVSEADSSIESLNQLLGSDVESDDEIGNSQEQVNDGDAVMTPATEREVLERRLRKLSIEEKLNELKKKKKNTASKRRDEMVFRNV